MHIALHDAYNMVHIAWCILHDVDCMMHIAWCISQHVSHRAYCIMNIASYTWHHASRIIHIVSWILHKEYSTYGFRNNESLVLHQAYGIMHPIWCISPYKNCMIHTTSCISHHAYCIINLHHAHYIVIKLYTWTYLNRLPS